MRFEEWQPPTIEDGRLTKWNWLVQHPEYLQLGKNTDIGAFTYINAKYGVEIQDEAQIGSHCSIYSLSTIDNKQAKVTIKKNARIGSHSTIMPGVTIGENTVVGAHSFVNKDLPDNVIAYGVPAKVVKKNEAATWKIPLFKTYSDQDDIDAVTKVIKRGTYWAIGPEIEEFEQKIAQFVGTKYALTFNSGTSALHTLLLAHKIKPGDEVIVPSFTFIATANAVVLVGAKPVFAESERDTYGLDAEDVLQKITPRTKAIIQLHYGGFPGRDSAKIREIADQHNIVFLEDAAESIGSRIGTKRVGTFGHSAMFSMCQNKVLATGEGGFIVTDNQEVYERAKLLRSHGRVEEAEDYFSNVGDNDYIQAGFNFRLPTVLAALALSQLAKIQKIIDLRRTHAHYLNNHLSQIAEIKTPQELPEYYSVYQMYTIRLHNKERRDMLQNHLAKKGIMNKVYFNPVHLKTIYRRDFGCKEGDLPKTEELSNTVLNIPLYPSLTQAELDYMIKSIEEFFQ